MTEDITESEVYNHAEKRNNQVFNGENIGGLYLVESLHQVAVRVNQFLSILTLLRIFLVPMMKSLVLSFPKSELLN